MQIDTSTSVCAFAQLVGSLASGPTRAQFDITLLPGVASQVSPHNCSSTEPYVCPHLLHSLYASLDCPHFYPHPPPAPPPSTPPYPPPSQPPSPPPPSPPPPSPPPPPPPPSPPPPSSPPSPLPATPPGLTIHHSLVVMFTVTARRRRLLHSAGMAQVRVRLAVLLDYPIAAVSLSASQDHIAARVDSGTDGTAAETALRLLRSMSTQTIGVALGLQLASQPLLELDQRVVQMVPPSPPPPPPALPPSTPPPVWPPPALPPSPPTVTTAFIRVETPLWTHVHCPVQNLRRHTASLVWLSWVVCAMALQPWCSPRRLQPRHLPAISCVMLTAQTPPVRYHALQCMPFAAHPFTMFLLVRRDRLVVHRSQGACLT